MDAFETWKDPSTGAEFCFSHSDEKFTTGVLYLPPNTQLPKHNRPKAFENLKQIAGKCKMTVFDGENSSFDVELKPRHTLRMEKGQYHIHANPFDEKSFTLFKAEGDITAVMKVLRETFKRV